MSMYSRVSMLIPTHVPCCVCVLTTAAHFKNSKTLSWFSELVEQCPWMAGFMLKWGYGAPGHGKGTAPFLWFVHIETRSGS